MIVSHRRTSSLSCTYSNLFYFIYKVVFFFQRKQFRSIHIGDVQVDIENLGITDLISSSSSTQIFIAQNVKLSITIIPNRSDVYFPIQTLSTTRWANRARCRNSTTISCQCRLNPSPPRNSRSSWELAQKTDTHVQHVRNQHQVHLIREPEAKVEAVTADYRFQTKTGSKEFYPVKNRHGIMRKSIIRGACWQKYKQMLIYQV